MKKKAIGIAAVLAVLAAGVYLYTIWTAKKAATDAVDAYNAAAQEYNDAIAPYNAAVDGISQANEGLREVLDTAKAALDQKKEAYEPDTQKELQKTVEKAGKAFATVPALIDPFEMRDIPESRDKKELAQVQFEAEEALKAVKEAAARIPDVPEIPDFSGEIESVRTALKSYENSVQKLANVTMPPDTFVKDRLERIGTVVEAQAVTADNDPNGLLGEKDGYVGCVYFLDERIDRSLLPQEAFPKEEDADDESEDSDNDGEDGGESENDAELQGDGGESENDAESSEDGGESENDAESPDGGSAEEDAGEADASGEGTEEAGTDGTATVETAEESGTSGTAAAETAAESAGTAGTAAAENVAAVETAEESGTSGTAAAETAAEMTTGTTAEESAAAGQAEEPKKENTIDVVMIGTIGGGAVEIYSSREEAEKRAEYIAFFAGSVMDGGGCDVEGTCLIRTSRLFDEEEQKKLTEEIRKALLTVDE